MATISSSAAAQCSPDPTASGQTTTCIGVDQDGLVVGTTGSTVLIDGQAAVLSSGGPAVSVVIPAGQLYAPLTTTINVAGTIAGGGQAGIAVSSPPASGNPYGVQTDATITVLAGADISGSNGITVANGAGNGAYVLASLDNAGSITGNAGPALLTTAAFGGFSAIVNRAGGYIGGIAGGIASLDNAGTIDGGAASAIAYASPPLLYGPGLTNTGLITASGPAATILNPLPSGLQNSGTISNTGSGSAVSGSYFSLVNAQGANITAVGSDTLQASLSLSVINSGTISNSGGQAALRAQTVGLTNLGSIEGDVFAGNANSQSYDGSKVDTANGTIVGNILFGAGNDELDVRYSGGALAGVTGAIDGGAGQDTLALAFAGDTTLIGAVPLPNSFEALRLVPDQNVTVTLAAGFSTPVAFSIAGSGTVDNEATLAMAGPVIVAGPYYAGPAGFPRLRNGGTIQNTAADSGYAISVSPFMPLDAFENTGTITSAADGVDITAVSFVNSGTIDAVGTGANVFLQGMTFANSGTIRSSAGTALALAGWYPATASNATNSGTIDGALTGVALASGLINTGLITSPGTAVALGGSGRLENRAGGVVDGNIVASQGANATVINAGTINGDVSFPGSYYYGVNTYRSMPGGVLNGNLTLGERDVLVADIAASGSGSFGGINGSVIASGSTLLFAVRSSTSAGYAPPPGFATVGYELYDNAALTLTGAGTSTATLALSGSGSVDVTADITTTKRALLQSGTFDIDGGTSPQTGGIAIASHGSLTYNADPDPTSYFYSAIGLNPADSFTNTGTITVHDSGTPLYGSVNSAIAGGSVVNSGTITIDHGQAVSYASSLTNSGTISAGGAVATNIAGGITNSGTLTSTGGVAIVAQYNGLVDNRAGGTINGAPINGQTGIAIAGPGGVVRNAGTINGSVLLNIAPYGGASFAPGAYIADGGTLNGALVFGAGNDLLVESGSGYGVAGAIDGGDGTDFVAHRRASSGTVTIGGALPTNFEGEIVLALGSQTVTTITAATPLTQGILVGGDGQIVNLASTSGAITASYFYFPSLPELSQLALRSFVNAGDVGSEISLNTDTLINKGTVGSASLQDNAAISQIGSSALSFDNSGHVVTSGTHSAVELSGYSLHGAAITNSGTIDGALVAHLGFEGDVAVTVRNSGRIGSAADGRGAVSLNYLPYGYPAGSRTTTVDNSGTIETSGVGGAALAVAEPQYASSASSTLAITNSGTIRATGGGMTTFDPYAGASVFYGPSTAIATAVLIDTGGAGPATISNAAGGRIEATGVLSTAVQSFAPLVLTNAGTITGGAGFSLAADDSAVQRFGTTRFAGAIQTFGTADDSIDNAGSIIGSIDLGDGDDTIVNRGSMAGDVYLGAGDDTASLLTGSSITGALDGGDGTDIIALGGSGTGSFSGGTGFERLAVNGGAWTMTSAQAYAAGTTIAAGANLIVSAQAFGGTIADAGTLTLDQAGTGSFAGTVTGSGSLTKTGTGNLLLGVQGYAGATTVAAGTLTLAGASSSTSYIVARDATLTSTSGAAIDSTTAPLSILNSGTITGTQGVAVTRAFSPSGADSGATTIVNTGTIRGTAAEGVQLTGAFDDVVTTSGLIAGGNGRAVDMGAGNDTVEITTGTSFVGAVDGGTGNDIVRLGGAGSGTFGNAVNFEHLAVTSGTWSFTGSSVFAQDMTVTGGRFVGLAGSVLTAPTIAVSGGAVFGSAGTVNGNVAVAGTLSPGASPGTMTINGNLALAGTSTSLFEITASVSDKLLVNGTVSIANGATLQLLASDGTTVGKTLDLIVSTGGIAGSFTNVIKPASLFGVLIQRADRIQLLGEFLNDAGYSPQVQRSIRYVNGVLESGRSSPAFVSALPLLATGSGAANPAAFARITPEAYASAGQIAVENGLTLAKVGRGHGFDAWRDTPGLFSFGSALANSRSLNANLASGTAHARINGYGFVGGIGFGSVNGSIGVFGGYLDSRQRIATLDARTDAHGGVVGVHGRWSDGAFGFKGTIAYDGGGARTRRALPDGIATGHYDLHSWIGDVAISYDMPLGAGWTVTPTLGATTVRWTRQALSETGNSAFALKVARERDRATFVDGALRFSGAAGRQAAIKPYMVIGLRYQVEGRAPVSLAGLDGGDLGFIASGAPRARLLATASLGADAALTDRLTIFGSVGGESGDGDALGSAQLGVRLGF